MSSHASSDNDDAWDNGSWDSGEGEDDIEDMVHQLHDADILGAQSPLRTPDDKQSVPAATPAVPQCQGGQSPMQYMMYPEGEGLDDAVTDEADAPSITSSNYKVDGTDDDVLNGKDGDKQLQPKGPDEDNYRYIDGPDHTSQVTSPSKEADGDVNGDNGDEFSLQSNASNGINNGKRSSPATPGNTESTQNASLQSAAASCQEIGCGPIKASELQCNCLELIMPLPTICNTESKLYLNKLPDGTATKTLPDGTLVLVNYERLLQNEATKRILLQRSVETHVTIIAELQAKLQALGKTNKQQTEELKSAATTSRGYIASSQYTSTSTAMQQIQHSRQWLEQKAKSKSIKLTFKVSLAVCILWLAVMNVSVHTRVIQKLVEFQQMEGEQRKHSFLRQQQKQHQPSSNGDELIAPMLESAKKFKDHNVQLNFSSPTEKKKQMLRSRHTNNITSSSAKKQTAIIIRTTGGNKTEDVAEATAGVELIDNKNQTDSRL